MVKDGLWVQDNAHCMCEEGYERPDGNWLGCSIGTEESNSSEIEDPHEASLGVWSWSLYSDFHS